MESNSCTSDEIPCDFARENRDRLDEGKKQFNKIEADALEHKTLTYTEAKETQRQVGCLEGKIKNNTQLLFEVLRIHRDESFVKKLEDSMNPHLDNTKLAQLRRDEELLKQQNKNLRLRFRNRLIKLGIVIVAIAIIVLGSYSINII